MAVKGPQAQVFDAPRSDAWWREVGRERQQRPLSLVNTIDRRDRVAREREAEPSPDKVNGQIGHPGMPLWNVALPQFNDQADDQCNEHANHDSHSRSL